MDRFDDDDADLDVVEGATNALEAEDDLT